ncbi:MAG: hypothetical protein JXM70_20190 [Pirellulales bacterium]|nr:hypothetical protein [Pirellulales bacterium]
MLTQHTVSTPGKLSARQRQLRDRAHQLCFKDAVRLAADDIFDFTHRKSGGKALWSNKVSVWLGKTTFIHWTMNKDDIDIPRIVAETDGAPDSADDFRKAVKLELVAYWMEHLKSLPSKNTPNWMPLP